MKRMRQRTCGKRALDRYAKAAPREWVGAYADAVTRRRVGPPNGASTLVVTIAESGRVAPFAPGMAVAAMSRPSTRKSGKSMSHHFDSPTAIADAINVALWM